MKKTEHQKLAENEYFSRRGEINDKRLGAIEARLTEIEKTLSELQNNYLGHIAKGVYELSEKLNSLTSRLGGEPYE